MWQMRMPAKGFPGSSDGKESAFSAGDPGSIPGLGNKANTVCSYGIYRI